MVERGRFRDRRAAGRELAERLKEQLQGESPLILALPRGGVPVAFEVARELNADFDIFLVRKLGVPGQEELALGAIASGDVRIINQEVVQNLGISDDQIAAVAAAEQTELERRDREYRGTRAAPKLEGRHVILVDDGLATGATMRAAAVAVQAHSPKHLVVAVPVADRETCEAFGEIVDQVVCVATPEPFHAVGLWYEDFSQTTDAEVHQLLRRARAPEVDRAAEQEQRHESRQEAEGR